MEKHLRRGLSPAQIERNKLARMPDPVRLSRETIPSAAHPADLIIGKGNQSQVGTLVERTTLFVALVKLDSSKADVAAEAFTKILNRFESQMRRSMTYDQGSEMPHHKRLTQNTGVDVYFAHPRCTLGARHQRKHQRPTPPVSAQGHRSVVFSQKQLDDIAWLLNTRPGARHRRSCAACGVYQSRLRLRSLESAISARRACWLSSQICSRAALSRW